MRLFNRNFGVGKQQAVKFICPPHLFRVQDKYTFQYSHILWIMSPTKTIEATLVLATLVTGLMASTKICKLAHSGNIYSRWWFWLSIMSLRYQANRSTKRNDHVETWRVLISQWCPWASPCTYLRPQYLHTAGLLPSRLIYSIGWPKAGSIPARYKW